MVTGRRVTAGSADQELQNFSTESSEPVSLAEGIDMAEGIDSEPEPEGEAGVPVGRARRQEPGVHTFHFSRDERSEPRFRRPPTSESPTGSLSPSR
jgi:hypothetical protein